MTRPLRATPWSLMLLAPLAGAAEEPRSLMPDSLAAGNLLQVFAALAAVLVMFILLAWLLRRIGSRQGPYANAIRLLGGIAVGQRERVVLVQVGEQQLLLGVAPGRVSMLHALEENIDTGRGEQLFSEKLAALQKKAKPK